MAAEVFANNFSTRLAVGALVGDLTITVTDSPPSALTSGQFRVLVDSEYMVVTAVSGTGNTTWTVTRGQEGSAAAAHQAGVYVTHLFTAGSVSALGITSVTVAGAAAALTISRVANSFAGTVDPTQYWGYNMLADGSRPTNAEPGLAWGVEGNYNDGSGANKMESYLQFGSADGLVTRRPLMIQINRTTKVVTQFSQSSPVFTWFSGDDTAGAGGTTAMTLTGTTGGGSGGVLNFGSASHDFALQVNTNAFAHLYDNPLGAAGAALYVGTGGGDNSAVGLFDVGTSNTAVKGLVARGRTSQAGSLFEAQLPANSNAALVSVDSVGGLHPGNGTAIGGALWGGSGAPSAGLGSNGDYYFRTDTPGTANQRMYVKSAGAWSGVV